MPEPTEPPELTTALRQHLADEVSRASFEPIAAGDIRQLAGAPAPRRRGVGWLAVAAALAVLIPGGVVLARAWLRPIPAVPAPTVVATPSTATPTAGPSPAASWFLRITAPVAVGDYAQVNLDGAVYLVTVQGNGGSCRLQGYRYDPGIDLWQALPAGPAYPSNDCAPPVAFARGKGVDVVVFDRGPQVHRYLPASSTWQTLAPPDNLTACAPVGLDEGVFCLQPTAGRELEYRFYDAAATRWREGFLDLGLDEPPAAVTAHRVTVSGRERVLLVAAFGDGGMVAATWDPATRALAQPTAHPGTGQPLAILQTTGDGYAVLTADDPAADTGLVLELATGSWRTLDVPLPGGPLGREQPSDADWVVRVFDEASDRVVIGGYLYRPADGSWAAAPALPRVEPGDDQHDWVGDTGVCRRVAPFNCWGLSVGSLPEVVTAVDPAAITASNDQIR